MLTLGMATQSLFALITKFPPPRIVISQVALPHYETYSTYSAQNTVRTYNVIKLWHCRAVLNILKQIGHVLLLICNFTIKTYKLSRQFLVL